jgi:hypothetical protein
MSAALERISVPISVPVTKKKKFYLNLNQYRNAHHFTLSKAKVNFHEIVAPRVRHLPRYDTVTLIYTLYTGTEQLCDTNNICSIVDKFFSDVLVTCNKIEDDNRKIVVGSFFQYGGVDRTDPRVDVTIIPGSLFLGSLVEDQQQEEKPMQITLVQSEIEEGIRLFVMRKLTINSGQRIDIDLKATRGDEGYTAMIDIVDDSASAQAPAPAAPVTEPARRPRGSTTAVMSPTPVAKTERPASVTKTEPAAPVTPVAEPEVATAEAAPAESPVAATTEASVEPPISEVAKKTELAEEAAPATPRPSLFGGLSAPQNS